jgi:hypothetical protein
VSTVEALQQALTEEHRAIYVIELAGGRAAALGAVRLQKALTDTFEAHLAQRTWLEERIHELGLPPVAAELTYPLPSRMFTPAQLRAAVLQVEERCVGAYLALVAAADAGTDLRRFAVTSQAEAAVRTLRFGASPLPLPGCVS